MPPDTTQPTGPGIPTEEAEATILYEALCTIYGPREVDYGHPRENMARIAMIWSGILDFTVTPEQVCLCMAGLKLARQAKRHKRDNLVDAAGYLALVERLAEPDAAAGLDPAHLPDWLK